MPLHSHNHQQMTFAQIGTLFNDISNLTEGGVSPQTQATLLHDISTVQTQMQGLINQGAFTSGFTLTHAQNIADQMNFLTTQVSTYGQGTTTPKFINDVVRDVQDIVQGDPVLAAMAHQQNHSGFQQQSNILAPPTPYPDSGAQTTALLQFISDSNSLGARAQALAGADPHSADVQTLVSDIHNFSIAADAYSAAQGGVFSARFNNEFTLNGVQGTASREMVTGLLSQNADLVNGASTVLIQNAADVNGNMLTTQTFVPPPNGGIPAVIDTVHTAGVVFNDSVSALVGGIFGPTMSTDGTHVIAGNQTRILNDLHATVTGLNTAITDQHITGSTLTATNKVIATLTHEIGLVTNVDTALPPLTPVNAQIAADQATVLKTVNQNAGLAALSVGTDGTTGFVALPPGTAPTPPTSSHPTDPHLIASNTPTTTHVPVDHHMLHA